MSRFGGFLGGSGLPDPSNFNSAAPGIYSLDEAEAFRRLGYWPLKETRDPYYAVTQFILSADGQLRDASANAAALTVVGFTRQKVDGPAGRPISAAYNSTSNAYIKPTDSANLTIGTSDYTLECWVWPTGQGNNDQPLFDTRNTSNGQGGTYFGFRNSDGAVRADGAYSFGTGSVQVRQWNHISFVRENGQLRVYVNGVQQGSAVVSTLNHTSGTLVVGGYSYSPVGVNPLIGYIADARATIGAPRYSTTYTPDTAPAPIVQELIPPYAPTLGDSFYGDQSIAVNWRNAFNGGSDLTDFDIEYSTASDMSGGTIVNVPVGGAGPYGFSSPTTFTKPDNDTTADVLIPGVLELTRTNQYSIYNSAVQSAWPNSNKPQNPTDTEWALGWSDECDVATKTFGNFTDLWGGGGVGSNIVNAELVMRHVPTGRMWFIKFSQWTQGGGGGGFAYERREFYGCLALPTAHTVTGLTNDTPYYLRVRANNAVGNGAYSSIVGPIAPSSILPQRLIGGSPAGASTYIGTSFKQDNYSESTALANKIFDNSLSNNTTNQWRTNTVSRAFGVDFGTTQEILRYRMWRNTGNEGTPTHWILQGSNTESDWTTLQNNEGQSTYGSWVNIDTRTGVNLPKVTGASPADQPYGEFAVANPGSYRYYRLFVSNVRADGPGATTNRIFLAEMQFLAVIDAPAVPTNLAAVPTSDGANLSWAYAGMLDDFDVEWADDAAFTNILGTTSSTTLVATITGLTIGTTYYARVRANNSAGTSAYTAGVSFTPAAGYSPNSDNILRFRLDDQSTAAYAQIWTTTGYAKLVSSTGETSAVAGRGLTPYGWGNNYWAAYSIAPSITGLATGTERMISVISCDASGTPSGEIEFVDFSAAPPSSGVQRINLIDMSGCTSLKGCLALSSTSGIGVGGFMGPPQVTALPATITEVRAVGIGQALVNSFSNTNPYPWNGYITGYMYAGLGVAGQQLSAAALNQLYTDLVSGGGSIAVHSNPGTAADDPTIATGKGYTVYGS